MDIVLIGGTIEAFLVAEHYCKDNAVYVIEIEAELGLPSVHPGRCLLYTSPSPRDRTRSRMPSSA